MLETKPYKNFISDRHFYEGLRLTVGISFPALIMAWYGNLAIGVTMSLGALCVSVADNPGPIHHRRIGMLITLLLISILSIFTSWLHFSIILTALLITFAGFFFSMLAIYGDRATSIGIAALLIIILSLQHSPAGKEIYKNAALIFSGGLWYFLLSNLLQLIRPYKIIQQVLGDYLINIAGYFRSRSKFYGHAPNYDNIYEHIFEQQVNVQKQQSLLSELLFNTRKVVKESTNTSRRLLKIYLDASDLFENIMTSHEDYRVLNKNFSASGILEDFRKQILLLCNELEHIGINIKSGVECTANDSLNESMFLLTEKFELLRIKTINETNVENFVGLGRILTNIQHLTDQIYNLHYYTNISRKVSKGGKAVQHARQIEKQRIDLDLYFDNLTFRSNIFRHSIRVALALLAGFYISIALHLTHNAWILLTIIVILKPAYQITKTRNKDRLIGTFLGIIFGAGFLYIIKDNTALLVVMIGLMVVAYTYLRTNYFISVLALTAYLVIFYHFLYDQGIQQVITERMLDTLLGSAIAFLASLFIVPSWEHENITESMHSMLEAVSKYYLQLSAAYTGANKIQRIELNHSRKDMYVALANVTGAFNRMLSEPKRYQKGIKGVYRFAVMHHILASHLAALMFYKYVRRYSFQSPKLIPIIETTANNFSSAKLYLEGNQAAIVPSRQDAGNEINLHIQQLLTQRRAELQEGILESIIKDRLVHEKPIIDQFNYILSVSDEIAKACKKFYDESK